MRKLLLALTACALCAAPLRAQAAAAPTDLAPAPVAATATPVREEAKPAASLYPTSDEIRQQVASTERERVGRKAAMPNDFLYLVAAIVVGVVIAAVILD